MRFDGIPRSLQDFIDDFQRRLGNLERGRPGGGVPGPPGAPGAILLEANETAPGDIPPGTPTGTLVYRKLP